MRELHKAFFANTFIHRVFYKGVFLLLMFLCGAATAVMAARESKTEVAQDEGMIAELPRQWMGKTLRPLALSSVEQRFAHQFPGRIARLTTGQEMLVWREVRQPTRMLHPAVDCYRSLGYRIQAQQLERDAARRMWRCFDATPPKRGETLRVCERIEDAQGREFTDSSAWYWASVGGQSQGPWYAITVAREKT